MHISGIKRMYPQYPNKASNLTYPRKEKKNDGDFKEVLDVEIKKMESADQSNDSTNWGFVSLYLGKTKEKVSIKNNTVFLFYKK